MKNLKHGIIGILAIITLVIPLITCDNGNDNHLRSSYVSIYTVTFDSNGGSAVAPIDISHGQRITAPATTKPGYECKFDGWYVDPAFTAKYDFSRPVTSHITLYAKWGGAYILGDTGPGGGKIIYVKPSGFTNYTSAADTIGTTCWYLEAAPYNLGTLAWASAAFIPPAQGGTGVWTIITGTSYDIGTGRKNTALILATDAKAPAALACKNYRNNGYTDWFLPSRDELEQLKNAKKILGYQALNLPQDNYWSSTQYSGAQYAGGWNISGNINENGVGFGDVKHNNFSVRAVRAF